MTTENPYESPKSDISDIPSPSGAATRYAGFWARTVATIIDNIWLYGALYLLLTFTVGYSESYTPVQFAFDYVLPFVIVMAFWMYKQSTPGKMIFGMRIVDAKTLGEVPSSRLVVRYLAYFLSMLPLCLGFIWVAFDEKKQGWHDKLAGTVVVRP